MKDDVKVSLTIIFIITILILSFIPLTVHSDPELEPFIYEFVDIPNNTMGIGDHWVKTVNWSFFLQYIDWKLEYKRYSTSSWTDGNQYLTIEKEFNETMNGWKFNLIFDAVVDVYSARFTFAVDLPVLDYVVRDGWSVNLTYFNESFFFDWSDMASIPNIEFSKGILNDQFWFRFKRDNIPSGVYEFDPWFGSQDEGTSNIGVHDDIVYCRYQFTGGTGCIADNITVRLKEDCTPDQSCTSDITCAIYDDNGLVAQTEERSIDLTETYVWYTFDFTGSPELTNNEYYNLTVWGQRCSIPCGNSPLVSMNVGDNIRGKDDETYTGTYPDPFVSTGEWTGKVDIYCSYTCDEGCVEECLIDETSENPVNGTTSIEDCVEYYNVSVNVSTLCGTFDYVNISIEGLGYNNDTSPVNGTFHYNYTGELECGTQYKWWVNTSCDGNQNSSWYLFTTEACCVVTIENVIPINKTDCIDYNDTFLNISAWVNSSCDNIIDWVNISFGTNYSNQTTESEGLFWANFTGLTFVCNTNYTIYINTSDGDGCNNQTNNTWYWFLTCDCDVFVDNCPVSSNPTIVNGSCCNDLNLSWNITITDADGNNTNGSIESSNGNIVWWDNQPNGTRSLDIVNLTCETNYTVYLNFTSETNVSCIINETYWFITINCTGLCDCDDFYNETELGIYLSNNGYIKEDDDVNIGLDGTLLTLVLFTIFFVVGYTINKRSGGLLMIFSGFTLISFEYLVSSASILSAILVIPLLTPISILIIVLGVRKWLYPVEGEHTKSEGQ